MIYKKKSVRYCIMYQKVGLGGIFFITGVFNDRYIHVPYDCNTARIKRHFRGAGWSKG